MIKNPFVRCGFDHLSDVGLIPGEEDLPEKEIRTHSSILACKTRGQRSLAGCSPQHHKESNIN